MSRHSSLKLKTHILNKVVLPDRIDLTSFGVFNSKIIFSKRTLLYSLILDVHPAVSEDIRLTRDELSIGALLPYPKNNDRTLENVSLFRWNLDSEMRQKLEKSSHLLVERYRLPHYWWRSIEVKIMTDVLPVPADFGPIYVHEPYKHVDSPVKSDSLRNIADNVFSDPKMQASMKLIDNIEYPGIFIREKIDSKNVLIKWIRENWETVLKPANDKLPAILFRGIDLERFMIGVYFWKMKREGQDWDKIDEEITSLEQNNPDFFGNDTERIIVDRVYLQKVVDETEEYLQRFLRF